GTQRRLMRFASRHDFRSRGAVALALVLTDRARKRGLPLLESTLVTAGGQVAGLSGPATEAILRRHGISGVLAAEGGRTSPGSPRRARAYAAFLNSVGPDADLRSIEAFWIDRARAILAAPARPAPLRLRPRRSSGVRTIVAGLLAQVAERRRAGQGVKHAGAVLQHLVGAKLECALGSGQVEHHGFAVADAPGRRSGDFLIGDVAIHVTTTPGEGLIARCRENLDAGLCPVIITLPAGVAVAAALAANAGLEGRIDVFDAEQFVALNVYEIGRFASAGRKRTLADLVDRYNEIVEVHETDPSLQIEVRR
ncbi:MAG: DUF4928 family protein, partial [Terriglobales bacterium]